MWPIPTYLLGLFAIALLGCDGQGAETDLDRQDKIYRIATAQLVSKHHAVVGWDQGVGLSPFTIELEHRLLRTQHRPVLLTGPVKDIQEIDGWTILIMEHRSPNLLSPIIYAILRITPDQAAVLRNSNQGLPISAAVIADIFDVKPGKVANITLPKEEDPQWTISGSCRDLVSIGLLGELSIYKGLRADSARIQH